MNLSKVKSTRVYERIKTFLYYGYAKTNLMLNGADIYKNINVFCLFIGHGRSGHSIIGALLDAHKNAILSDEANSLKYVSMGLNFYQVCSIIRKKSRRQARRKKQKSGLFGKTYSYFVPNQWQGRFEKLLVLGDSMAGVTVRTLAAEPHLLPTLNQVVPVGLKFIHVVRNPFDNISTISIRRKSDLTKPIENYFNKNCAALAKVRRQIDLKNLILIRHEDLISNPRDTLMQLNDFLNIETTNQYLDDCASIIFQSPSKTRQKVTWQPNQIKRVEEYIQEYEFLDGYTYER